MVSFGFGDVIDRFEKHFGSGLTKLVLGAVMGCITILLMGLAFTSVLRPFFEGIGGFLFGSPTTRTLAAGFNVTAAAGSLGFIIYLSWRIVVERRKRRKADDVFHSLDELLEKQESEYKRLRKNADESDYALLRLRDMIAELPNGSAMVSRLMSESPQLAALWRDSESADR